MAGARVIPREWTDADGVKHKAYQVWYYDADGKRRAKQFDKAKLANAFADKINKGAFDTTAKDYTVKEAGEAWLEACKLGREGEPPIGPTTHSNYEGFLENHIVPRIGTVKLADLTIKRCRAFRDQLVKEIARLKAKQVFIAFKSILKNARLSEWMTHSPAADLSIKMDASEAKKKRREQPMPTREEVAVLVRVATRLRDGDLTLCSTKGRGMLMKGWRRFYPMSMMIFTSGMRLSEVRGVAWPNINLEKGHVDVQQRADRYGNVGPCKSAAAYRRIWLPRAVIEALLVWKDYCPASRHNLVFPNGQGNAENSSNLYRRMLRPLMLAAGVVKASGRPKYGAHAMRHFFAAARIDEGANPKQLQAEIGHADITLTFDTYGYLFPDKDDAGARRAETLMENVNKAGATAAPDCNTAATRKAKSLKVAA